MKQKTRFCRSYRALGKNLDTKYIHIGGIRRQRVDKKKGKVISVWIISEGVYLDEIGDKSWRSIAALKSD